MQIHEARKGLRVRYTLPGTRRAEDGVISSWNATYIFVLFDATTTHLGEGQGTAQACSPSTLRVIGVDVLPRVNSRDSQNWGLTSEAE